MALAPQGAQAAGAGGTVVTTYCPHDADPLCCPPCQTAARGPAPAAPEPEWSRPFPARYEGTCPGCGFPIEVGQSVRLLIEGERRRVFHADADCTGGVR